MTVESVSAPEGTSTRAFPSGVAAVPPEPSMTTPHSIRKPADAVALACTLTLAGAAGSAMQLEATPSRVTVWLPTATSLKVTEPLSATSCGVPLSSARV